MEVFDNILMYILIWITLVTSIVLIKAAFGENKKEIEKLRKENRELRIQLKEEVERVRNYYEQLLKDAVVRNVFMTALYNAWKNNLLKKCYVDGGEVRVLADGTIICEMGEKSYAIGGTSGE